MNVKSASLGTLWLTAIALCGYFAYDIRLYAIRDYGYVIHEFDPWFNMRATQYLADNGWTRFFEWYDYMSWYPLGRPVGTTIYPGMQITSVAIWSALNKLFKYDISLNDVCCLVPAWFGVSATVFLALLASECGGSYTAGVAAAAIMSVIPAHTMRSVGGGYDNESIAVTALCATFYFWVRALREDAKVTDGRATRDSIVFGVLTGISYTYMVAVWGGFTFVGNMIALHAASLFFAGRFTSKLHRAYTLFFIIGTFGATRVPVVGMLPFKSVEQLSLFVTFLALQLLEFCEVCRRRDGLNVAQTFVLRVKTTLPTLIAVAALITIVYPTGYFSPLTARVRGLFVKHTRTGNPLVDSVAEHQPASADAYKQYLGFIFDVAPLGFYLCLARALPIQLIRLGDSNGGTPAKIWSDANLFILLYAYVGYCFANKMVRLIILLGPAASALGGIAIGFALEQFFVAPFQALQLAVTGKSKTTIIKQSKRIRLPHVPIIIPNVWEHHLMCLLRIVVGVYLLQTSAFFQKAHGFYEYSHQMAQAMSQPQIMFRAQVQDGREIIVDDYREAYFWLRDNTEDDARVMAWWDYGYQITGIGNRTTIADGNTWNHEHIATLGRILSAPEKRAHAIAKHLADYILIWNDDLGKSPHMARIGNSVYRDICPDDPTCSRFGFYEGGMPTPMMENSLLYKLSTNQNVNPNRFTLAFKSQFGLVQIYKIENVSEKSKKWIADPSNRICDAPGSWYCEGQYPPALRKLIKKRKNFAQLEDFNTGGGNLEYTKKYMEHMEGGPPPANHKDSKVEKGPDLGLTFIGCYGKESDLGSDRLYGGGTLGARVSQAALFAQDHAKRLVAMARVGNDGHSFIFDTPPAEVSLELDNGCRRKCNDNNRYYCGCADAGCGSLKALDGEKHVRRWAVYEVTENLNFNEDPDKDFHL